MCDASAMYELMLAVEEQRRQTAALRRATAICSEELEALRCCLSDAGVLSPTEFLVKLQHQRFAAARAAYPLVIEDRWEDAIGTGEIAQTIGLLAGIADARRIAVVSSHLGSSIRRAWPVILAQCPTRIYICGGHDGMQPLNSVERFSMRAGTWEVLPPMAQRRSGASAGVLHGRLYVCGGFNGQVTLSSAESFDHHAGLWEAVAPMSVGRVDASTGVVGGSLCVCGGLDDLGQPLNIVEHFNPAIGTWHLLPDMIERRCRAAAGVICGRLYICGGRDDAQHLRSVESIAASSNVWTHAPLMPQERAGATAAVADAKLFVCGGNAGRQALDTVDGFDPLAGNWERVASMSVGRRFATAAGSLGANGGGWFCIFGGSGGGQSLSSAESFDVNTGTWSLMPPMRWARDDAAAATALE